MDKLQLQKEMDYFDQNKSEYLKTYHNTYVVIKDNKLLGNFTTQQEAYQAGIKVYGNEAFLIKYVTENESPSVHAPAITLVR